MEQQARDIWAPARALLNQLDPSERKTIRAPANSETELNNCSGNNSDKMFPLVLVRVLGLFQRADGAGERAAGRPLGVAA